MTAEREDRRTMADLAREALQVQDACNLSGVVLGFGRSIIRLRRLLEEQNQGSTDRINQHPVCVLWSSKIDSLTGSQKLGASWAWAEKQVKDDDERKAAEARAKAEAEADAMICLGCGGQVEARGDDLCPACARATEAAE